MKRFIGILIPVLLIVVLESSAYADDGTSVDSTNTLLANQVQQGQGYATAGGGDASSIALGGDSSSDASSIALSGGSNSGASANIITSSTSNYESRTPPVSTYPPYLPYWNHGGWGTLKAYFPNGPTADEKVYERVFDPDNPDDMRELRGVLESLPYGGPLSVLGGIFNGVRAVFGGPNNFHRGRGFEIANSLIRSARPEEKPLLVFIDSNVDRDLLRQAGYAYVGKISMEGNASRNWDHVYDAAVAEALPWDVDVLLVSGGMKGVTVGKNTTFPLAGGAYTQLDFSLSLFGGSAGGITEGKGKAMVSAEGYRYWPEAAGRRRIPTSFYDKIRAKAGQNHKQVPQGERTIGEAVKEIPASDTDTDTEVPPPSTTRQGQETFRGISVSQELLELSGFREGQVQYMTVR